MAAGECLIGTGPVAKASSIHEIKVELNKLNAQKITMTLDCCRTVERGADRAEEFVVDLRLSLPFFDAHLYFNVLSFRDKETIKPEHHERTFIFYGTLETLPAEDGNGRRKSFSQILSSVCKENGGAINILDIEK